VALGVAVLVGVMYDPRELLKNANVLAFYRVVRQGESNQIDSGPDSAYTLVNGGKHFFDFTDHPYKGLSTFHGGRAAGAPQFLPSTWAEMQQRYSLKDFSPENQDIGFVGCVLKHKGAIEAVVEGRFEDAVALLRSEWTSLPGASESNAKWNMVAARDLYMRYGGTIASGSESAAHVDTQPAAPIEDRSTTYVGGADNSNAIVQNEPQQGASKMPFLALLQMFGPMLVNMIPQIKGIISPKGEVAQRNVALAEAVVNTIVDTTKQPNMQGAIEAMQKDPALKDQVTQALVTHPDILPFMEVGGGVEKARASDLQVMAAEKPFYKTSAVFWVSMLLLPMVYWYVGGSIVGGIEIPDDWPWYAQVPLKFFGKAWDDGAKVGLANLIVGLVLGGICGVYYGISVTQAKQQPAGQSPNTGG
jgi:muramidase (phage lysozyme)